MVRIWRSAAGTLLFLFMLIDLATFVVAQTVGARLNAGSGQAGQQVAWTAVDAFLVWRIWRGGNWAWAVLLVISVLPLVMLLAAAIFPLDAYILALGAFGVAQVAILLSPAVRHHIRLGPVARRPSR